MSKGGPPIWQAMQAGRDPSGYLQRRSRRSGDPFLISLPGLGEILMSGSETAAREMFGARPNTFEPMLNNPLEPLLGGSSLILLKSDEHRRRRKLVSRSFASHAIRGYGDAIQAATRACLNEHEAAGMLSVGAFTRDVTLRVIVRAVFGATEPDLEAEYRIRTQAFLERYTTSLLLVPALRKDFAPHSPWAKFQKARGALDQLLQQQIERHRQDPDQPRTSVLAHLIEARDEDGRGLTDDELKDELRTLLVAGHDTSATTLFWALFHIAGDESLQDWLQQQVGALGDEPTVKDCVSHAGLEAICNEAMRLYPVVPIVLRRLRKPFRYAGVDLEAGRNIGLALPVLHQNATAWHDAGRFDPRRFLEQKPGAFDTAPFGGGERRCPGAIFAGYEMKIVLGTLLARYRLTLTSAKKPRSVIKGIIAGPSRDVIVSLSPGSPMDSGH